MTTKKISEEIKESKAKTEEIEKEIDTNEVVEEASNIKGMAIEVYNQEYKVSDLIKLMEKENKTYAEFEIVKRFKELMDNYYRGIMHAVLRPCCGRTYTIDDLKNKLDYNVIDIRCSRKSIRFDKETVDTIIDFQEKYGKK